MFCVYVLDFLYSLFAVIRYDATKSNKYARRVVLALRIGYIICQMSHTIRIRSSETSGYKSSERYRNEQLTLNTKLIKLYM